MADKNSTYISEFENGQTVDSILKRAMVGGAIDKSLSEKAPAGYGLGENAQSWFSSDFNDYTSNGWWRFGSVASFTNAPPLGYGVLRVDCRESYLCQQTFYALGNGIIMRRYHNGATWSEWEYVNPPMTPGVEYRTTKRYNNKPVYARLYKYPGEVVAGYNEVAHGIAGIESVIRADLVRYDPNSPTHGMQQGFHKNLDVNKSTFLVEASHVYLSFVAYRDGGEVYCTFYYTKEGAV